MVFEDHNLSAWSSDNRIVHIIFDDDSQHELKYAKKLCGFSFLLE